ncbi:MAG: hypothetical protein JNL96_03565 [Planctomycetaceae bacterium]|nr:hypothetical protein [Planctomycetaceae bacterium]
MPHEFEVKLTVDKDTGEMLAAYFQIRRGKANEVREFANGNAFANYNRNGELLGIELLGPCRVDVVDKIVNKDEEAKRFVRRTAPRPMLVGAR